MPTLLITNTVTQTMSSLGNKHGVTDTEAALGHSTARVPGGATVGGPKTSSRLRNAASGKAIRATDEHSNGSAASGSASGGRSSSRFHGRAAVDTPSTSSSSSSRKRHGENSGPPVKSGQRGAGASAAGAASASARTDEHSNGSPGRVDDDNELMTLSQVSHVWLTTHHACTTHHAPRTTHHAHHALADCAFQATSLGPHVVGVVTSDVDSVCLAPPGTDCIRREASHCGRG
jgi:hypothetical protein